MRVREFNDKFSSACDDIYKIAGEKTHYRISDAKNMTKKAIPIIAASFGISGKQVSDNIVNIDSLIEKYGKALVKSRHFDGLLLAVAFSVLEGTGAEKKGFGKWLLLKSIFVGGIKLSKSANQ